MSSDLAIFAPAYTFVDGKLDAFLGQGVQRAIAEVSGPLRLALVLYVTLYGVAILRGAIAEPLTDFAVRSIKLTLIYGLATTAAYGDWITQPLFHALPDTLARAIAGTDGGTAGEAFDSFFGHARLLGDAAAKQASLMDWLPLLVSGAVLIVGALAAALGFGIVLLAKVALALLVALGPIFVACSLFDASRRYFFGWLSQAVNYLVLFALILSVFQLILALVDSQWGAIEGGDPVTGGLVFVALCLLGAILFLQTPAIAAGIAGGASAGLADFGAAVGLSGRALSSNRTATAGGRPQTPREGGSIRPLGAAAGASLLASIAVGAVAVLTPLKTVEPYVVRVDRATGAVEVLTGLNGRKDLTYEEAVTKSFLATYVRARESWLAPAAEANFRQVSIMSTPAEQQRWAEAFRPSNPTSPQLVYGAAAEAEARITAISFVAPKVANVRFHRRVRRNGQTTEGDWIATVAFDYAKAPMAEADRLRNPLGFQVASYRADPETLP